MQSFASANRRTGTAIFMSMVNATELKPGMIFKYNDAPYEILEAQKLSVGGYGGTIKMRAENLLTGKFYPLTFRLTEKFEEVELERIDATFIYSHRGQFWFTKKGSKERFMLDADILEDKAKFLKPNLDVQAFLYEGEIINVKLPIKISYKVTEAPPSIKGNTAQGGVKQIVLEGGLTINAPLFVNQDDVIVVNTDTNEYVERTEKA